MRIIFCLPGRVFSRSYFLSWNNTVDLLRSKNIDVKLSNSYNPIVATTRNSILVAGMWKRNSSLQKPFDEKVKYDYLFWIDDDIVWQPEHVLQLLNHQKDIVSGCYSMIDNKTYPICKEMNDDYLLEKGNYKLITKEEMKEEKEIFKVDFVGFGFVAVKYGVFESMEYPWFENPTRQIGEIKDVTSEDVYWCMKAKQKGFEIFVDPNCIVGHEKSLIL